MSVPHYLAIGHITRDLLPDGSSTAGGTALYTAITAERLGVQAAILTSAAHFPEQLPPSIAFVSAPTNRTATFENRYTAEGRQQWLHDEAPPIRINDIPGSWLEAPLVHLGPVLHECTLEYLAAFPRARVIATPQGWMRRWQHPLPAPITYHPWQPDPALLARLNALVLSIEDVRGDEAIVQEYARHCPLVALTRSAKGATLYINGQPHAIPPRPSVERDPTGAGDVFAAAFLIRLHETDDPIAAATFAAEIAGMSVEGPGVSAIPQRTMDDGPSTMEG